MTATINLILRVCDELELDDQITLADKIKRRAIRKRRAKLKKECDEARADVKAGNYIEGVDALFAAVDKENANAKNKKR